jgi:DNA-binding beta-propeller fold protein YncE
MAITSDGKELWVTQRFLRRVAVVDLEQMKVVASVPVGKSPHGVFMLTSGPAAPGVASESGPADRCAPCRRVPARRR